MAEVTEQQIIEALTQIIDPDKKADIVSLGMVSGIAVKNGHVAFAIEVEPARGSNLEPLRKAAEKAVHDLPGVVSVSAVLTAERNVQGGAKGGHAHGHGQPQAEAPLLPHVKAIIAVAHAILRIIYVLFTRREPYRDSGFDYEAAKVSKNAPRWIKALKKVGYWPNTKPVPKLALATAC